ncbi:hypothetical protein [Streptomyces thermoviolaceus]|uniref:hypothetical protein n=1 Tax=Streptomyces thermoviolaceus TaxID=1952 RepID=UPI0016723C0F|nr:hypothetical protein [Streptomyces thermoviolaceus]GGV80480.1 hypothetical protein GCM10010499_43510 [Streptomyces thermoviolaceus subsp. apingens]
MATPWATPEDLRLHLRLDTIDTAQAAALISAAETLIRAELQQTIDPVTDDELAMVGTGRRLLSLPEMPVTKVTSVTLDGQVLQEGTDYRWNRYGILTRLGEPTWRGRLAACWPLDADITVVYDHGYAPVPAVLKQVCLQVAARGWVSAVPVLSESIGDYSVTYPRDIRTGLPISGQTLTDYEKTLLQPYALGYSSR